MTTKIEQASRVEHGSQTTVTPASSAASTSSPKISMFTAKSGFVIPKNKLSGSLVPVFRGGKKLGGSDAASEESTKQVQRKTKWGPDVTQDAAVRKGRALAYQTRVDQITKQLNLGILDNEDGPSLVTQTSDCESSGHAVNSEKSELLELERREAIGEILKLNTSYKAPADYRPLLRQAKVLIPIKEYPGYNFIGLVFGPASDTQKRLEKETGAKIRVFGTKPDTGEKEVTVDGNDTQSLYEELYVHICADTYEKVDAAVALIELLVTPVSVNPVAVSTTSTAVSGDNVNVIHPSRGTPIPYTIPLPLVNQGVAQPIIGPGQAPPPGQFQPYPSPWFPTGSPLGFITPQNSSALTLNNPVHVSSAPLNPTNMPSLFGPRPILAAGFGSVAQNPSLHPSRPQPILHRPYMPQAPSLGYTGQPRNPPMPAFQSTPGQPNISPPPLFSGNQPTPTGPSQNMWPLMPQSAASGAFAVRSLTPSASPPGWSQAPTGNPASLGPSNMGQMTLPIVPHRPQPVASQPIVVSGAPPFNVASNNMVSPPFQPSTYQSSGVAASNRPIGAMGFTFVPQPQMGFASASSSLLPTSAPSASPAIARPMLPSMSSNPVLGAAPIRLPVPSASTPPHHPQSGIQSLVSGSATSYAPIKTPSATDLKPLHPRSNDFTFQPHRPQNLATQMVHRPSIQPAPQSMPPWNLTVHPPQAPQTQSFHPAIQNSAPPPVMQGFSRPQVSGQMSQPQTQISLTSAGNLSSPHALPRHPAFPNPGPASPATPVPQMGMRKFSPAPQAMNAAGAFPHRPGNPMQLQQNYPPMATRPQGLLGPNQQFNDSQPFPSGKPASNSFGGQQNYDPFSPTSVPLMPQLGANPSKTKKQESDPEYEDLMASVGVK